MTAAAIRRSTWRRRAVVASMLAPSATGVVAFTIAPLVFVAIWSFTRFDLITPPRYTGLDNYRFAFDTDPFLWQAVRNTLWILGVGLPLQIAVALALAALLSRRGRATTAARTAVFVPSVIPPVAAALAFGWLLDPGNGPVDHLLGAAGLPEPLWFHDPHWAKPGLVLLGLWGIGPVVILFVGGMVRIPVHLYEAARLEGAGRWRQFRTITLPMLAPVLLFTLVVGVVGALQYFTEAYVTATTLPGDPSSGQPEGATRFYSTWLYREAFVSFHAGYASMMAVLLFVVALAVIAALLAVTRRVGTWDRRA